MEYLDELDDSAIQALVELGGNVKLHAPPTATPSLSHRVRRRRIPVSYLLRLEPPLTTPRDVADALGLHRVPALETGFGEDGDVSFCRLDQAGVDKLEVWTAEAIPNKRFTKVRIGMAHKDSGALPFLGRDPTLPQNRPSAITSAPMSQHQQYSLYYFFYGTLANTKRLSRLLHIPESNLPPLLSARVLDGRIRSWASKYMALVDSPGSEAEGWIYPVLSAEQEDILRVYEGDSYEVVDSRVRLEDESLVQNEKRNLVSIARTFRFVGFEDELSR